MFGRSVASASIPFLAGLPSRQGNNSSTPCLVEWTDQFGGRPCAGPRCRLLSSQPTLSFHLNFCNSGNGTTNLLEQFPWVLVRRGHICDSGGIIFNFYITTFVFTLYVSLLLFNKNNQTIPNLFAGNDRAKSMFEDRETSFWGSSKYPIIREGCFESYGKQNWEI